MTIQSINSTDEGLEIFWSDSNVSCFPWFWLRDHSESLMDLHPDTKQRQIDSFSGRSLGPNAGCGPSGDRDWPEQVGQGNQQRTAQRRGQYHWPAVRGF